MPANKALRTGIRWATDLRGPSSRSEADLQSIGANVRGVRGRASAGALAEEMARNLGFLHRVERGSPDPSIGVLVVLAGALQVRSASLAKPNFCLQ